MSDSGRIRVGDWRVMPALNRLERGDESVRIEPRAMDVLVYLAQRPGQVVSVDELIATVWKGIVVTDHSVYLAISQLRQALGDGGDERQYIETIRKRGYRLSASVASLEAGSDESRPALTGDGHSRRYLPSVARWLGVALGVAVTGVAITFVIRDEPDPRTSGGLPKVAVLPCANLSPDPDDAFFAAGIHEEILNRLAQLSGLRVIARTSMLQYADSRAPIRSIAAELDAAAVMECSVRYAGDAVLVTVQLIDPSTDTHLWSDAYSGDRSDIHGLFEMQVDIATNIARALDAELSPAEERRVGRASTNSMEAYTQILRLFEAYRRYGPPQALFGYVNRAIEVDPDYAFAYAARGSLQIASAFSGSVLRGAAPAAEPDPPDAERRLELAREDALRALEIDPELGFAHSILATLSMATGDREAARQSFERSAELSPGDPLVLRNYAAFQLEENQLREAFQAMERARQLDPNFAEPILYAIVGEYELARSFAQNDIDRNPLNPAGHLAIALLDATIFADAETAEQELRLVEELARENSTFFHLTTQLQVVYVYGRLGLTADARRVYDDVIAALPDEAVLTPAARMRAHLAFGEIDKAREWAARMVDSPVPGGQPAPLVFMHNTFNDPALERPEFVELRRRLGYAD